jgi:hypothetical protein
MAAFQPNGAPPPSPTNQRVTGKMYTKDRSMEEPSAPRAIKTHEVPLFVEQFVQAARNAIEAGTCKSMFSSASCSRASVGLLSIFLDAHVSFLMFVFFLFYLINYFLYSHLIIFKKIGSCRI